MHNKLIPILSFVALFLSACVENSNVNINTGDSENSTKVVGTGEVVEKTVEVGSFTEFENTGFASITIKHADEHKITLRAQQEILDLLTCNVSNNKLVAGVKEGYNVRTNKGIQIDIETPDIISAISNTGAGNIELQLEELDDLLIDITGAGKLKCYNTQIKNCKVNITGAGSCNVFVTNNLDVSISGAGVVSYKGNPKVTKDIQGIGLVKNRN